ncbi:MAG: response regulator [Candidatus Bathyarchaeota archaeon]
MTHEMKTDMTILYVDNEPREAEMVKHVLEGTSSGVKVESVNLPNDVKVKLIDGRYDVVLVEYKLPGMNGIDLGAKVKGIKDVAVVLYTGYGSEKVATEALIRGIDDYVQKSIDPEHYEALISRLREVVKRKRAEKHRDISLKIIRTLDWEADLREMLGEIIRIIQSSLNIKAAGIRLKQGDDYPYYVFEGFPDNYILQENVLCVYDLEGQLMRDDAGDPALDCICGNILRERTDPSEPFFTEKGSFWTNSMSQLLDNNTVMDNLTSTRDACYMEGYESVALFPLRGGDSTLGLLQLNDPRPGCFEPDDVDFLERLTRTIGMVLGAVYRRTEALSSSERYRGIFRRIPTPTLIIDPEDMTILEANEAAMDSLGIPLDRLEGLTCHEALTDRINPCEEYEEACPIIQMLEMRRGSPSVVNPRKDERGDIVYVEETVKPMMGPKGLIEATVLNYRQLAGLEP